MPESLEQNDLMNPDWTYHPDAGPDPDTDPSFQIKAQTLEKVLT